MENCKKSMLIEPNDNVAVAVEPIEAGDYTMVAGEKLTANQFIKEGHKIARVDIAKGGEILKYGVHIGVASKDIKKGDWVYEENVYDDFEEINQEQRAYYRSMAPDALDYTDKPIYTKEELHLPETIMGYKRADGSFGIRNQVLVISLVQCSNNAAQRISSACNVPATFVDAACGEFPDPQGLYHGRHASQHLWCSVAVSGLPADQPRGGGRGHPQDRPSCGEYQHPVRRRCDEGYR